jgi:hypothetical protein
LLSAVGFCYAWMFGTSGQQSLHEQLVPAIVPHDGLLIGQVESRSNQVKYSCEASVGFHGIWVLKNPHGEAIAHGSARVMKEICSALNFVADLDW